MVVPILTPSGETSLLDLQPDLTLQDQPPPYSVRFIPTKGQGMFATRPIAAGEIIVREKPLILMPDEVFSDEDSDRIETWLDKQINRMTSQDRETFFNLSDSRTDPPSPVGIFFTNDMNFNGDAGLFPIIARANHACRPNADFVSRPQIGQQDLVAVRNIQAGEEICISYLPASETGSDIRETRKEYLRFWYGFECTCEACLDEGVHFRRQESLRKKIRLIQLSKKQELRELDFLIDHLEKIGCKAPYIVDQCAAALPKALESNNFKMAAKIIARGHAFASIVNADFGNEWDSFVQGTPVEIGGKIYYFPPM